MNIVYMNIVIFSHREDVESAAPRDHAVTPDLRVYQVRPELQDDQAPRVIQVNRERWDLQDLLATMVLRAHVDLMARWVNKVHKECLV
jgi:hypothetical protein